MDHRFWFCVPSCTERSGTRQVLVPFILILLQKIFIKTYLPNNMIQSPKLGHDNMGDHFSPQTEGAHLVGEWWVWRLQGQNGSKCCLGI